MTTTDVQADIQEFVDADFARLRARPPIRAFPPEEYERRLEKLCRQMEADGIDLLVLSSPEAICWLHGYTSRWHKAHSPKAWPPLQCTVVRADQRRYMLFEGAEHIDLIHMTSVSQDNRLIHRDERPRWMEFIIKNLKDEGWLKGTAGQEKRSYLPNPVVSAQVTEALEAAGCTVVDATDTVREVRRIKSPLELEAIERAAEICDIGLEALGKELHAGMTELEAWGIVINAMAKAGGEPAGLHEAVHAGGYAFTHTISTRRVLEKGDHVYADPSGVYKRYHANIGRGYWIGEPPPIAVKIAEIQAGAFDVLCTVAKDGTPVRDVARELRRYYEEAGVLGLRGTAYLGGYELGLSFPPDWVGEWNFNVQDENAPGCFEAGMVTNFESVLFFSMIDTLVYEKDGARTLSRIPLAWTVVDA